MDILFYQTVLGFKARECDRRNAQDSAFPSSEFDNTCIRLKSIIELLQLKEDGKRLGYGGDFIECMEKCVNVITASPDVKEAVKRYYDEDY